MVRTNDGFEIAETDLRLRGPGDITGTQQSGVLNLKIADLVTDREILVVARNLAAKILRDDPALSQPDHACVRRVYDELTREKTIWNYIS